MHAAVFVTIAAALLVQAPVAPAPPPPWCGGIKRDIGRGFHLQQYMFDGDSEFTLTFRSAKAANVSEAVRAGAPFELQFSQMAFGQSKPRVSGLEGPFLSFSTFAFVRPDGTRVAPGVLTLECGGETALSAEYPGAFHRASFEGQLMWASWPFREQRARERQCLEELRQNQRLKVTIAERAGDPPFAVIDDAIPLQWALAEVHRIWRGELDKAERGECRLMPAPPPPF